MPPPPRDRRIEAHATTPLGPISVVSERWDEKYEHVGCSPLYHLQLSLLPAPEYGYACFPENWGQKRFEPIGPLFLLPAQHTIRVRNACEQQKSVVYHFNEKAIEPWFEDEIPWNSLQLERSLALTDPEIRRLMTRIGQELRTPGFASETLIELMAAEVIIALARQLRTLDTPAPQGGLAPWRLRFIDEYLNAHLSQVSLPKLAEQCQLSTRHLSRAFKISKGCSLGHYIAQQRVDTARKLLTNGYSIKEVALRVGFNSTSNFSAAYKRITGSPPSHSITL